MAGQQVVSSKHSWHTQKRHSGMLRAMVDCFSQQVSKVSVEVLLNVVIWNIGTL